MFMFFSLLAASVDGFNSGFVIGTMGVKLKMKDILLSFAIIFVCCLGASVTGSQLAQTEIGRYINLMGVAVMLYLAYTALAGKTEEINPGSRIAIVSLSVATDAAVVCLYLAMCGYNVLTVSVISAFLHCLLMAVGAVISNKITQSHPLIYARYIRAGFFVTMAVVKGYKLL